MRGHEINRHRQEARSRRQGAFGNGQVNTDQEVNVHQKVVTGERRTHTTGAWPLGCYSLA